MSFVQRIENRVGLPGDSETRRSQKTLAALILLLAGSLLVLNSVGNWSGGLTNVAWVFLAFGTLLIISFFILMRRPSYYAALIFVMLVLSLAANLLAHLFAGGATAGTIHIAWAVLTPLLAVLLLDRRALALIMVPFMIVVVAAVIFEPWARANMPEVESWFMLSTFAYGLAVLGLIIALSALYLVGQIESYRQRADDLLLSILPVSIATRLKESPETIADGYREVTVLFADIVDFTSMSSGADPVEVVTFLNEIFSEFDTLARKHGLEKIKTIGDAYMAASGLPVPRDDHAQAIVEFAFDILDIVEHLNGFHGEPIRLRIGINSGPVVAGVIGRDKFSYDLWGDAVNVASRMESNGLANEIQVTEAVKEKLQGQYTFLEREPIAVKGKGMMVTYLLRHP